MPGFQRPVSSRWRRRSSLSSRCGTPRAVPATPWGGARPLFFHARQASRQKGHEVLRRHRTAVKITLRFVAAMDAQQIEHLFALDAFGNRPQAEAARHLDNRADNRRVFRIGRQIADKRLVDLEFVHLEPFEIRKARITGTEVVD